MKFSDIVLRSVLQQQQRFHHFRDNFQTDDFKLKNNLQHCNNFHKLL